MITHNKSRRSYRASGGPLRSKKTPKQQVNAMRRNDHKEVARAPGFGDGHRARSAGNKNEAAHSRFRGLFLRFIERILRGGGSVAGLNAQSSALVK
jgi:hypothetical protein